MRGRVYRGHKPAPTGFLNPTHAPVTHKTEEPSLDSRTWHRVETLFHRALDLPEGERALFVEEACGGDSTVLREVQKLLAAEAGGGTAGDFIEDALVEVARGLVSHGGEPLDGVRFGQYRILRELGSGGMGTVFLAERADEEFRKQVALKLVRGGLAGEAGRARFRSERQILAQLEHPGIARLLDGGTTADGAPYVVMEFVDGKPITQYADGAGLGIEDRLWLFLEVCAAVQYAHNNLVIHRDLKPGNILVTGEGRAKLLDFGIAKLLDPGKGEAGQAMTLAGGHMTPEYASPEQISGGPVGTGADVYALGVLLYQLLAGRLPFTLADSTPADIHRLVLTQEPERPSRMAAPGRSLDGDLDWIILKALRKEPDRRYLSVSQFADDVRAFLSGMPVSARPSSVGYRARRFASRHRVAVGAAVVVLAMSAWYAHSLAQERDLARLEAEKADRVAEFVIGLFRVSDPDAYQGRDLTVRELLDSGAIRLRSELREQPGVRGEMLGVIGMVYSELGHSEEASALLREALDLAAGTLGENAEEAMAIRHSLAGSLIRRGEVEEGIDLARSVLDFRRAQRPPDNRNLAASLLSLVAGLRFIGELEEAETLATEAVEVAKRLEGVVRDTVLSTVLNDRGLVRISSGRYEDALSDLEASLRIQEATRHPTHTGLLSTRNNLAQVLLSLGRYDDAVEISRTSLAVRESVLGPDHPAVAMDLNNLSAALKERGEFPEAEALQTRALEIYLDRLGPEAPAVVTSYNNLANLRQDQGDPEGALEYHRKSVTLGTRIFGEASESVGTSYYNMAAVYQEMGDLELALEYQRQALRVDSLTLGPDHPFIAQDLASIGATLRDLGEHRAAEEVFQHSTELGTRLLGPDHPQVGRSHIETAKLLLLTGRTSEAVALIRKGLGILGLALSEDHWEMGATESLLGEGLWALGEKEEAAVLLRRGWEKLLAGRGESHPLTRKAQDRLRVLGPDSR